MEKYARIWSNAIQTVHRYPAVMACAFIGAAAAVGVKLTEGTSGDGFEVVKFSLTACLGISVFFGIRMLAQRSGKRMLLETTGIFFLAAFYFILPKHQKDFTEVYGFVVGPVFILAHLFVAFAPYLHRKTEQKFWQYNKNLFINSVLTAIFTGVLVGGVLLAILAVDRLFDFHFNDTIYPQTFFFLSIFGSAFIFLLFSGRGLFTLENDGSYPQILKFFTQFILIPLLLIYVVILYFYFAKIIVHWELPRGWVSYLVLAYSMVGIFALLLVYPLKNSGSKSWVRVFSKIFYFTLLPLLILLLTAIFTRILEYGYTEARYFVLLLALWLTAVVFYFISSKKDSIRFIPVSLFAFGLFGLIFPYFNAFSTANRSQKSELLKILNQNRILENGSINFNKKITDKVAEEIADKFQFLSDRNEGNFLSTLVPGQSELKNSISRKEHWNVRNLTKFAFKNIEYDKSELYFGKDLLLVSALKVFPVTNYDYSVSIYSNERVELPLSREIISFHNTKNASLLVMEAPEKMTHTYDLRPFFNQISTPYKGRSGRIELPKISTEFDLHDYHFKVYIKSINYYKNQNNISADPHEITLLIRKK